MSTNKAVPISILWEAMMLWVLHVQMGFGAVRLERFQESMKELWSVDNAKADEMLATVKQEVGLDRIGTGIVYLQQV